MIEDSHGVVLDKVVAALKVLHADMLSKVGLGLDDGLAQPALIVLFRAVQNLPMPLQNRLACERGIANGAQKATVGHHERLKGGGAAA